MSQLQLSLKEYVVVKNPHQTSACPEDNFEIWTREEYDQYVRESLTVGAAPAYGLLATFNKDDEYKDQPVSAGTWVRASERIPKNDDQYFLKVDGLNRMGNFYDGEHNKKMCYITGVAPYEVSEKKFSGIEWLDDSAASPAGDGWVSAADQKPEHNIGVLVYIPDEDDHITSGMWDIDDKWVLLDEYRVPECEVTHWRPLPTPPNKSV